MYQFSLISDLIVSALQRVGSFSFSEGLCKINFPHITVIPSLPLNQMSL